MEYAGLTDPAVRRPMKSKAVLRRLRSMFLWLYFLVDECWYFVYSNS